MRHQVPTSFPRIVPSIASLLLLSGLSAGCAETATEEPARAPKSEPIYLARPCAPMKEQPPAAVPVGMILEVADVLEPVGKPIKDWLSKHPVQTHHVAKISLETMTGTTVPGPFGTCSDPDCSTSEDTSLEVTVTKAPTEASAPVELQLILTMKDGQKRSLSIKTTDQEPILASFATPPEQTVVVTPYYLYDPKQHSMGLLLECASRTPRAQRPN